MIHAKESQGDQEYLDRGTGARSGQKVAPSFLHIDLVEKPIAILRFNCAESRRRYGTLKERMYAQ
jgi:hypothetical protein